MFSYILLYYIYLIFRYLYTLESLEKKIVNLARQGFEAKFKNQRLSKFYFPIQCSNKTQRL